MSLHPLKTTQTLQRIKGETVIPYSNKASCMVAARP